jgi:hypothetical protein
MLAGPGPRRDRAVPFNDSDQQTLNSGARRKIATCAGTPNFWVSQRRENKGINKEDNVRRTTDAIEQK